MPTKNGEPEDPYPQVILSVCGGVADVIFKPRGIGVTILDYDVEGADSPDPLLSQDPDGRDCCIQEWPPDKQVAGNRHWPLVKQSLRSARQLFRRQWQCPGCGRKANCSYEDLAIAGTPYCADCDQEMEMV